MAKKDKDTRPSRRSRSTPQFQRRHYEFLVDMFHNVYCDVDGELAKMAIAVRWAFMLRLTNPNFNADTFTEACVYGFKNNRR